eukprot:4256573-Pyramimonas_sp.AAC.2
MGSRIWGSRTSASPRHCANPCPLLGLSKGLVVRGLSVIERLEIAVKLAVLIHAFSVATVSINSNLRAELQSRHPETWSVGWIQLIWCILNG